MATTESGAVSELLGVSDNPLVSPLRGESAGGLAEQAQLSTSERRFSQMWNVSPSLGRDSRSVDNGSRVASSLFRVRSVGGTARPRIERPSRMVLLPVGSEEDDVASRRVSQSHIRTPSSVSSPSFHSFNNSSGASRRHSTLGLGLTGIPREPMSSVSPVESPGKVSAPEAPSASQQTLGYVYSAAGPAGQVPSSSGFSSVVEAVAGIVSGSQLSSLGALSPLRDMGRSNAKHFNLTAKKTSPPSGNRRSARNDLILRRIQATRDATCAEAAAEGATGLRELQQNFAEISKDHEAHEGVDWEFWQAVVNDYPLVAQTNPAKLREAVRQGFPAQLRSTLWQVISGSKKAALEQLYSSLVTDVSPHAKAIEKDLDRTPLVREVNRDALGRVLSAYSLFDPEVGYTQGMAFIAAPLLLVDMSEYEVFCLFVQLMKVYELRRFFLPEMPLLELRLYQLERLVEDRLEKVHIHLKREGVDVSMFASQWFLTLFAYKFPLSLVQRIVDVVITEGSETLLRFGLALITAAAPKILTLDFDRLVPFLKEKICDSYVDRPNDLVEASASIDLTPAILAKYELENHEIGRKDRERIQQLDSLRAANGKLTMQVRQLEDSLAELNREHIDIANKMVSTGLELARLRHENEQLRCKNALLMQCGGDDVMSKAELLTTVEELREVRHRLECQLSSLQESLAAAMDSPH